MTVDHAELQRDVGRVEGKQDAMGARLDRLEKIIEDGFKDVRAELAKLQAAENQRLGIGRFTTTIISVLTAVAAVLGLDWFKGH